MKDSPKMKKQRKLLAIIFILSGNMIFHTTATEQYQEDTTQLSTQQIMKYLCELPLMEQKAFHKNVKYAIGSKNHTYPISCISGHVLTLSDYIAAFNETARMIRDSSESLRNTNVEAIFNNPANLNPIALSVIKEQKIFEKFLKIGDIPDGSVVGRSHPIRWKTCETAAFSTLVFFYISFQIYEMLALTICGFNCTFFAPK